MNVIVNSQLLAAELRLLAKIVPSKPAIAILSHALLTADDKLSFWATDLEVGLSCSCSAQVSEPGTIALPVITLLSLCEQFTNDDVLIASDKQQITVKCGAFKSRLQAMPADDFPRPPESEGLASVIDGDALRQLIARTRYAVNATGSKYVLKGALLTLAGPVAAMVATDAKRLALATASRTGPDVKFIIPAKALDMLATHLNDDCEVTISDKHLFFASGGRLLWSRTIDGQFPAYERIIPRDNNLIVTVDRAALSAALRRIVLVAEQNVATWFDVQPGKLALSSQSAEVGSADEVVSIDYDGAPIKVCMNGSYALDFLNAASGQTVTLALKDEKSAALFVDGDSHIAVIILMRGN